LDHKTLQKLNAKGYYPLIVDAKGDIIYPVGEKKLKFDNDDESLKMPQVGFYCHKFDKTGKIKSKVKSSSIKPLKKDAAYVPLRCNEDGNFTLFNEGKNAMEAVDVHKVSCTKKGLYPVLKKSQDETTLCSSVGADGRTDELQNNIHYVEIGWNMSAMTNGPEQLVAPTEIKDMIQLCIDEKEYGTIWTRHIIRGKSLLFQDKGGSRPSFKTDNPRQKRFFDGLSSSKLMRMYSKRSQKLMETFYELKDVINKTSSSANYLAKGHLSPDAAFVYQREQDATYYYINAAPQFQSFNAGNWRFLEEGVRNLAKSLERSILTYTGTLGLLTYDNKNNGEKTELYLWYKKQKKSTVTKAIPVPKYYYKIVYDETVKQGIAFLGLNDPYSEDLKETDLLCNNVCDQIEWFKEEVPKMNIEEKGHITCCTIQELAEVVENVNTFKTDAGVKILDEILDDFSLLACSLECNDERSECNLCKPSV